MLLSFKFRSHGFILPVKNVSSAPDPVIVLIMKQTTLFIGNVAIMLTQYIKFINLIAYQD